MILSKVNGWVQKKLRRLGGSPLITEKEETLDVFSEKLYYDAAASPRSNDHVLSKPLLSICDLADATHRAIHNTIAIASIFAFSPVAFFPETCLTRKAQHLYWREASNTIAHLGPTAIKFLQWASTRQDLFPEQFCLYVTRFQAKVPVEPFPFMLIPLARSFSEAKQSSFIVATHPIGSGSVAEVFRLLLPRKYPVSRNRLLASMTKASDSGLYDETVVKILRPFVQAKIRSDLEVMRQSAWVFSQISGEWRKWCPIVKSVEQFTRMILPQTNLIVERDNLVKFRQYFESSRSRALLEMAGGRVVVPHVRHDIGSAEVLIESYEAGLPFDQWLEAHAAKTVEVENKHPVEMNLKNKLLFGKLTETDIILEPADKYLGSRLARMGAHMFLQMLLMDNFVHSDLHPGNIIIRWRENCKENTDALLKMITKEKCESDRSWRHFRAVLRNIRIRFAYNRLNWARLGMKTPCLELIILDGGLTSTLSHDDRTNFIELFRAVAFGDGWEAGECCETVWTFFCRKVDS